VAWLVPLDGGFTPAHEPVVKTTIPAAPPPTSQEITVAWTNGRNHPGQGPLFRTIVGTSFGFLGADRSGTLWHSPDGMSWEPTLTELKGVSVASSGSTTLVSGVRSGRAVLLRSVDGVEWSEVDRSEVPEQVRDLVATTPSGLTWLGSAYGSSEGVLAVVDADRVTTVHEPPWDEHVCCGTTTLLQVGGNVVAYQYDGNSPQFSHAWEYLGNRKWSDTFDVPLSIEHAVVGDTMLKFDHTHATCCSNPILGESLWPLLSSNDGITWTDTGQISGHDVHSLHVNAGLSFWIYGPQIGGGGNDIEVVPGTTLWLSTDGQNWQRLDIPQGIDERFQHGPTGFVHVAGETIFIFYNSEDELADQYWVGTVETN